MFINTMNIAMNILNVIPSFNCVTQSPKETHLFPKKEMSSIKPTLPINQFPQIDKMIFLIIRPDQ